MKKTAAVFTALLLFALSAFSAFAEEEPVVSSAGSFSMSTEYPSMTALAGDSLSFSLDFVNEGPGQTLDLSTGKLPEGWTASFSGGGNVVDRLYMKNGSMSGPVSLQLQVPEETEAGTYEVEAIAKGETGTSSISIRLYIEKEELGESNLAIQYGSQEGNSSTSFSYSMTLQNNTPNEQSYSLTATVPTGWTSAFTADSTQVSAVTVAARSSQSIIAVITPSASAEAGEYQIPVAATSATEELTGELSLTITGTYVVALSTPSGRLSFDATANKKTGVSVSITNNGNIDLQNLNLSSSAPTGWTVEFSESTIETLEAGATKEIMAYFTPAEDALSGDYAASLTVKNSEASSSAAFRVTVKTETKWGIAGALIILAVLACLGVIFKKFGRR